MSELLSSTEDGILTLTLNRPEKRNALNDSLIGGLKEAIRDSDAKPGLRSIIIRGAGKDFCSGADLSALRKIADNGILENLEDAESLMELFQLMRRCRVPVIAAVHGRALAGGCGLATACDLVLASETARFGYPEVKIGFVPAMVMAILRRNISEKQAFELITQGFDFSAGYAKEIGLINEVYPDEGFDEDVAAYVGRYMKLSASAVALSKKLLYQMDSMTFDNALSIGAEINAIARLTDDCQNGISRFLDKSD
ncbi:MAG: enoyl-CoA hydratase/isomerase family protein [Pyrinomonadaceae bacterium]|nr:enoyl-CoA hydratase/isomerase family protein [Pyrinomonadaceae bacterium]